ncbi:MAG: N-acetylmuramoyl-L-alanine amidase [uncultured Chthoniobacterales bacterium]|uniref:N-acetylmuramoyl-L-alanine amidase n=1 Tax=uncultured Chthoniobacterales bacterium TaxID=1836801 RepID=A0A6J4ITM6_9BACT|nr:MAG: N-acetylmuramoyl-L-alanine amidase [uncultured Chthoniobacterales bacterium]
MLSRSRNAKLQNGLALAGLLLMALCLVWTQLLPAPDRVARDEDAPRLSGPIALVIIDAGHGGNDTGAIRDHVREKDLTLDVARRLERLLKASGIATKMTRSTDETVSLAARAAAANEERDCVFVSIHFDEGKRTAASGVGTFYAARQAAPVPLVASWFPFVQPASDKQGSSFESQSLAELIQESLVMKTQAINRGTRAEQFYVVANVRHPAVLVEGGFLSNNDDVMKLTREDYRQQLAAAISEGVTRYRVLVSERGATASAGQP